MMNESRATIEAMNNGRAVVDYVRRRAETARQFAMRRRDATEEYIAKLANLQYSARRTQFERMEAEVRERGLDAVLESIRFAHRMQLLNEVQYRDAAYLAVSIGCAGMRFHEYAEFGGNAERWLAETAKIERQQKQLRAS